ncbi:MULTISPECIES: hypothetical protein [Paenibacillus]|uniref:hypothetical protein n=1 Tax=Paenibacillus TaxID=44249 RepID=UPI002FDFD948
MSYDEYFRRELELKKFHNAINQPFAFDIVKIGKDRPGPKKKKTWITRFRDTVIGVKGPV